MITSFLLGAEVNLKGFALCLFTFQYFSASLEVPEFTRLQNGRMKIELANTQRTQQLQSKAEIMKWVTMVLFALNWILMLVACTLFVAGGYFQSSQTIQYLYWSQTITTAFLFIALSALLCFAVQKIWRSLRLIP